MGSSLQRTRRIIQPNSFDLHAVPSTTNFVNGMFSQRSSRFLVEVTLGRAEAPRPRPLRRGEIHRRQRGGSGQQEPVHAGDDETVSRGAGALVEGKEPFVNGPRPRGPLCRSGFLVRHSLGDGGTPRIFWVLWRVRVPADRKAPGGFCRRQRRERRIPSADSVLVCHCEEWRSRRDEAIHLAGSPRRLAPPRDDKANLDAAPPFPPLPPVKPTVLLGCGCV
jgi:hypothetical protein